MGKMRENENIPSTDSSQRDELSGRDEKRKEGKDPFKITGKLRAGRRYIYTHPPRVRELPNRLSIGLQAVFGLRPTHNWVFAACGPGHLRRISLRTCLTGNPNPQRDTDICLIT